MNTRPFILLFAALSLSAWTDATWSNGDERDGPSAASVAANYRRLDLVTPEPVAVDAQLAALCRGVLPEEIRQTRNAYGPHALTWVRIFMNSAAHEAFDKMTHDYPPGSVVVKQKLTFPGAALDAEGSAIDGVGGMIKREPGYDLENGDWEYFYFSDPTAIESGHIDSCTGCHQSAKDRDHVFGDWGHTR